MSQPNLISRIDELIGESGIVGEYANRKMLYIIASTYKMGNQLHGLIQATSGSGKSHLINSIAALMPQEDVLNMTRVTSKSLYHYQKDDLINKLILIQDLDGLDEQAQFAFRELQSANKLSSSTTYKDRFGNLKSGVKLVEGRFASLVATTHSEVYFDNMSRSIVLGIDESAEQTYRIINYQNRCISGQIDQVKEMQAKELLQNCMRTLKPYSIVNLYAEKLLLPLEAKTLRRLNSHYHAFVSQITLLNQFQRKTDNQGRLITTIEDLEVACEILFNAIILKLDELDSSTRQFFDGLKAYMSKECRGEHSTFTAREIRQAFNLSKTHTFRFLEGLLQLEYLVIEEGSANRGFKYKITYWDDFTKTREKVKSSLMLQLKQLKK